MDHRHDGIFAVSGTPVAADHCITPCACCVFDLEDQRQVWDVCTVVFVCCVAAFRRCSAPNRHDHDGTRDGAPGLALRGAHFLATQKRSVDIFFHRASLVCLALHGVPSSPVSATCDGSSSAHKNIAPHAGPLHRLSDRTCIRLRAVQSTHYCELCECKYDRKDDVEDLRA